MDQFQKQSSTQHESHSTVQKQEEAIDCWRYGQVTSAPLNVRKQPSLSAPRWNNVWPINRIALIKPAADGWYETLYRGEQAFVSAKFVRPLSYPMTDRIVDRMFFMAIPEVGRDKSIYFNGYNGKWCHRFADWLPMHAGMPKERIPNTSNCGAGIVWFCTDAYSSGYYFQNAEHKARMIRAYPELKQIQPALTEEEKTYIPAPGDYIYYRWRNAPAGVNVSHVGIVWKATDEEVFTVEGNVNGQVGLRKRSLSDPCIVGYGKPNY